MTFEITLIDRKNDKIITKYLHNQDALFRVMNLFGENFADHSFDLNEELEIRFKRIK